MTFSKGIGRVIDLALIDKDQFDVSIREHARACQNSHYVALRFAKYAFGVLKRG